MTSAAVAVALGVSQPTITRIERGHVGIRARDLEAMLDLYQVDGDHRADLLELGSGGWREGGWWSKYSAFLQRGYATYIGFEAEVNEIAEWEPRLIPGHLQTEDYARAVITANRVIVPPNHVTTLLAVRMKRQRLLAERGVRIHAVVDEAVLRRVVGDPVVMAEQLRHLTKVAEDPRITLQVMPFQRGAEAGMFQGFVVLSYDDGLQVVWGESVSGDSGMEEERADRCILAFDLLRDAALDPEQSIKLIREVGGSI
jgi:transcriptional regulator with XRE-family HTH domain